jgi:hypothetical protein
VGHLEYIKIPPEESVYRYEIAWIRIKDVSNPMPILYVDSSSGDGLFPSCPCVPTPNMHPDMRDCVESYAIHMILTCRARITFVALILSLIIYKQRGTSSVPLLLTEEAPLLVFKSLLRSLLRIVLNHERVWYCNGLLKPNNNHQ